MNQKNNNSSTLEIKVLKKGFSYDYLMFCSPEN
jgi:hypothetical protein